MRKIISGNLLVEISIATQSNILSRHTKLSSFLVYIEAHKIRGVILIAYLLHSTNKEFLENVKSEKTIDVHRITIGRNYQILPAKHIILSFNNCNLPKRTKAAS